MEAYTIYEVTRRSDSEYPSFAGLQIEDEEIIEQVEVEADHSGCEVFYCENCNLTYSLSEIDAVQTKDWGFSCRYHGIHSHIKCLECETVLCDGGHRAEHRTDSADVIRVKVPGCGADFEQQMNARDEVVKYIEIERNWLKAYDYENLSETPIVNDERRWLQLAANYGPSWPQFIEVEERELKDIKNAICSVIPEDEGARWANQDDILAVGWAHDQVREGRRVYVASDEDGYYFAAEVKYF